MEENKNKLNDDQPDNEESTTGTNEKTDANQSNAARVAATSGDGAGATSYRDRNRSDTTRSNEATSGTDTNTGGLGAGGGNSAGEIM